MFYKENVRKDLKAISFSIFVIVVLLRWPSISGRRYLDFKVDHYMTSWVDSRRRQISKMKTGAF